MVPKKTVVRTSTGAMIQVKFNEACFTIYCKVEPDDSTIDKIARAIDNKMQLGVVNKNKVEAGLKDLLKDQYTVVLRRNGTKKEGFTWSVDLS